MPCLAYLVNLPSQKQTNKQGKPGALLTALEVDKITLQDSITWQRKSRINNNNNNNNNNNFYLPYDYNSAIGGQLKVRLQRYLTCRRCCTPDARLYSVLVYLVLVQKLP